jgi:two-component system response regulator RegX3
MKGRIIIIEDEKELGELIQLYLGKEGVGALLCSSAEEGLDLYRSQGADLVVLDINLPGMDGFEFLQTLRKESQVPVIIVSAREADEDIVMGLGIGADEFVSKPFAPRVLIARIRALMRRSRTPEVKTLAFGPYSMDPEGYSLTREGKRITLSTKEFEVLRHLVRNAGKAMSADEIYEQVWESAYGDLTAVAVYIRRIRQKIEEDPRNPNYVQTIHGYGYRFNPETIRG